jgi:hypothetical protein
LLLLLIYLIDHRIKKGIVVFLELLSHPVHFLIGEVIEQMADAFMGVLISSGLELLVEIDDEETFLPHLVLVRTQLEQELLGDVAEVLQDHLNV